MTSRILKFTISPDAPTMIHLPRSSRIIMVAEQNTLVRFWMETPHMESGQADTNIRRTFELVSTGAIIDPTFMQHRGTAICAGGELVWHLYERISPPLSQEKPQ